MKLYNARVRLSGSISNEVNKTQITAAEIKVLQRMHGEDSVVDIQEVGQVKGRSDAKERARLAAEYPKGPTVDGKERLEGPAFIASIFGVSGVPLPQNYEAPAVEEMEEVEVAPEEPEQIELAEVKPIKVVRVPKTKPQAEPAASADLMA